MKILESKPLLTIEEIFIETEKHKDSYICENFTVHPEGKEKAGGILFGIIEIKATKQEESNKIIQVIVNTLNKNYYQQIVSSPDPKKLNLETVFEYALQKTNEALTEMIQIGQINLVLENLHYFIAVIKENEKTKNLELYFSQNGLIKALLVHRTKKNNYKILDIVDNTKNPEIQQNDKLKIFSSIISGQVFLHDTLIICTEIFNNYIPNHKINNILANNTLHHSLDYFKALINNIKNNSYLTYSSLFIRLEDKKFFEDKPISQKSITEFVSTKEKTEKLLTPAFSLNLKKSFKKIIKSIYLKILIKKSKNKEAKPKRTLIKNSFRNFKNLFSRKKLSLTSLKNIFKNPKKLKTSQKVIGIFIILIIIGIITSIPVIKNYNQTKQQEQIYLTKLNETKNILQEAEQKYIYHEENNSLTLLQQVENNITELNKLIQENKLKNQHLNLTQNISTLKNKLLHLEKLTPQLLTSLINLNNPQFLVNQKNKLIITNKKEIYSFDNKELKKLNNLDNSQINLLFSDEANTYLLADKKLIKLIDNNLNTVNFSLAEKNQQIISAKLYNGNIYSINENLQQIFKYTKTDNGFSAGTTWIKEISANLETPIDLAIDGSVYLLTTNNQIIKLHAGKQENFENINFINGLKLTKIKTDFEYKYLYLLDTQNNRLVIIDKETQKLVKQLEFPNLKTIKDFTVDEVNKRLWLLTTENLYQGELNF